MARFFLIALTSLGLVCGSSAVEALESGTWSIFPPPTPRAGDGAVCDTLRHRMIVFGGENYNYSGRNETWILPLSGPPIWWELRTDGVEPPPRSQPSVVFDHARDRLVMLGGSTNSVPRSDVWVLSFAGTPAWSQLAIGGLTPPARYWRTAIYDPVGDRVILFGGMSSSNAVFDDIWALSFSGTPTWSQLSPSGTLPPGRSGHSAIYDPIRQRMLVFGGYNGSNAVLNDVWALSLSGPPAWTQIVPTGSTPGRELHSAVYDALRDRMVIFGGATQYEDDKNDAWELTLGSTPAWSQIATSAVLPIGRKQHGAVYDSGQDRMVIFGGYWGSSVYQQEAWSLSFSTAPSSWSDLTPVNGMPVVRSAQTFIYDPVRDRVIECGGLAGILRNDVWEMELSGNAHWARFADSDSMPAPRQWHTAIYDPARDRMIIFGGANESVFMNDVWARNLTGSRDWYRIQAVGTPPSPRYRHTAIYDPGTDRMVVFGGFDGDLKNDVWALSLSEPPTWTEIHPDSTPPSPRYFHSAIYDPVRQAMVVFGGQDGTLRNDVWALSLSGGPAWSPLATSETTPPPRESHGAVYDTPRGRMVVFGGWDGSGLRNDTWALPLSGQHAWSALTPDGDVPNGRESFGITYDELRGRLILVGGFAQIDRVVSWALTWGAAVAVPAWTPRVNGARLVALPNPFVSGTTFRHTAEARGRICLRIYDAAGRLVRELVNDVRAPGNYEMPWDGLDRSGRKVRSGIYTARLSMPDGVSSIRVTALR